MPRKTEWKNEYRVRAGELEEKVIFHMLQKFRAKSKASAIRACIRAMGIHLGVIGTGSAVEDEHEQSAADYIGGDD